MSRALTSFVLHIAVLPGSIRAGSMNRRLGLELVERFGRADIRAELVDLADFSLPIYHGDDEAANGAPRAAEALHDRLALADGLVVVSPEYNGGMPALLKNALDWVSRVDRAVFQRHLVGLASTSPGSRGGAAVLAAMHAMFAHMRVQLHGVSLSVPQYGDAFAHEEPYPLTRADAIEAVDEFVQTFVLALSARVGERA